MSRMKYFSDDSVTKAKFPSFRPEGFKADLDVPFCRHNLSIDYLCTTLESTCSSSSHGSPSLSRRCYLRWAYPLTTDGMRVWSWDDRACGAVKMGLKDGGPVKWDTAAGAQV